jgi:Phage gp6-like head-tail connector protein
MSGLNYSLTIPPTVEPVSLSLAKKQVRVDINDDDDLIQHLISVSREYCEQFTNRAFYPQTWTLWRDSFPYGDYRQTVPLDQRSPWNYSAYWNDLAIRLPKPMCQNVLAINFLDAQGNPQVLSTNSYFVDYNSRPCRITPVAGATWPLTQFYQPGSINVQYVAASYAPTITNENVSLTGSGPYVGTLAHQVISIMSVKDTNGNPLTYTTSVVNDNSGNPTDKTQLSLTSNPAGGKAIVTYQAGTLPYTIKQAMLLVLGHLYEHREENSEIALKSLPFGVKDLLGRHVFNVFGNFGSGY